MARPRTAPEDKRDESLNPRLTTAERAQIERAAAAHGLAASDFMHRRALGYRLPPLRREQRAMAGLAAALMPIGVNLIPNLDSASGNRVYDQYDSARTSGVCTTGETAGVGRGGQVVWFVSSRMCDGRATPAA